MPILFTQRFSDRASSNGRCLIPLLCILWSSAVFAQTATAPAPASVATPVPPAASKVAANTEKPAAPVAGAVAKPAEPVKPVAAAKPAEPVKPVAADKPAESVKPVTADKPAESVKPVVAAADPAPDSANVAVKKAAKPKKSKAAGTPCLIAEFRAIGMETGNGDLRRSLALEWLAKNGRQCSPQKLVALRNNRSQWMGAADSTVVAAAVDSLVEEITEGNPAAINLLYGTAPPPPKPTEDKKESGKRK